MDQDDPAFGIEGPDILSALRTRAAPPALLTPPGLLSPGERTASKRDMVRLKANSRFGSSKCPNRKLRTCSDAIQPGTSVRKPGTRVIRTVAPAAVQLVHHLTICLSPRCDTVLCKANCELIAARAVVCQLSFDCMLTRRKRVGSTFSVTNAQCGEHGSLIVFGARYLDLDTLTRRNPFIPARAVHRDSGGRKQPPSNQ